MNQRYSSTIALLVWMTAASYAQKPAGKTPEKVPAKAPEKKQYRFHGKVESIDKVGNYVSASNEKIEGWMDAMSMVYPVDDVSILDKLKPGDQIMATVYEGDYSLHQIKVVGLAAGRPEAKSESKAESKK
jgi:Cu/Ag efflux protein CusF